MGEGVGASKGRASRIHDSTVLSARFVSFLVPNLFFFLVKASRGVGSAGEGLRLAFLIIKPIELEDSRFDYLIGLDNPIASIASPNMYGREAEK
jgi:hypothetical protein